MWIARLIEAVSQKGMPKGRRCKQTTLGDPPISRKNPYVNWASLLPTHIGSNANWRAGSLSLDAAGRFLSLGKPRLECLVNGFRLVAGTTQLTKLSLEQNTL